jgi:hypothetical protein
MDVSLHSTVELSLALREEEDGHIVIVCGSENGMQVELTPQRARMLATHLVYLVSRAEIRRSLRFCRNPGNQIDSDEASSYLVNATLSAE